ncbi:hypothetical protein [Leptolyngbya sp. FACHB-541]|uniref:hypothetical protein n=1 Tax=Leptolyngbya sp. FACHB-541 TaxID=2692810 RepID=UPI001686D63E|nr:hypothetical protein [Leptolyngbya sp. FACHB-541]
MLSQQNVEMSQPVVVGFQHWHSQPIETISAQPLPSVGYAKTRLIPAFGDLRA